MAETSKNKIYYNDDENSVADVLTDMKKLAQSVDNAIEKSKYNDTQIKKDISNMKTETTAKDNAQDNKILKLQTEKAELEKELKEAQEDFYQNSIRGQASGEYIHIEDSSNCRSIIGIGGNHEQETRSGKNYLNTLTKYKAGEKVTVDGITYIFNEDGSITCNGTATADSVLTFSSNLQTINGSGKKIVGMITGTQVPAKLSILAYTSDWSKNTFELLSSVNKNITINMQENIDYTIFRIIAYKGTTLNNQTIYYQILDTSVNDLTYEQYGASPSPDYKSEIESVGSNVNLFDKDNMTIGKIWNGTTLLDSDVGNASPKIPVTAGKTYIRNAGYSSNYIIKENNSVVDVQGGTNAITMPEDAKYWMFNIPKDIDINTIKAEEGSISTPQSKYGQGSVKVTKCNKNIYNKNKEIICNGVGIGSSGELFSRSDQKLLIIPISKLETNIAISFTKTFSYSLRYAFSDKIVENIDCKIFDTGYVENSTTINIKVNKTVQNNKHNYLLLSFTKKDIYPDLQVEYKKEVSQYEEHQEQSYIMPVQKEMLTDDYLDWDNGEEVHCWNKLVLNGTENDSNFSVESNGEYTVINCLNILENGKKVDENKILCDKLVSKYGDTSNTEHIRNASSNYPNNIVIYIKSSRLEKSTVAAFKKYLSTNNIIIYYKTATEKRIAFTDEQKAVAKELSNARTYKNVTNITTDSIAILDLDYAKDLEELTEYSTEERVIGRWIDGKPLYSKVGSIKFTSVYDSSGLHTRGSLIDSDIDYGTVSKVLNKNLLSSSLFNTYGTSTSNVYVENRQGNSNKGYILGFTDRTDLLNTTIYVVVEYTKTTD